LRAFDALAAERGVRPTALQPLWSVAGYALGAATALLGPRGGDGLHRRGRGEIDRHYTRQLDSLETDGDDPSLPG
jgi:ubiquinone biosynthesis monooxygenase Coq7